MPDWASSGLRPGQVTALVETMEKFHGDQKKVVICELPTGFGKSLFAECIRQLLDDTKANYCCTTKSLQTQFVDDFKHFPGARLLMGGSNYPTDIFPERFKNGSIDSLSGEDCDYPNGQAGPLHDDNEENKYCSHCRSMNTCPKRKAKSRALGSKLAVLNTAYYLTAMNLGKPDFGKRGLVILDEADLLENSVMSFIEVTVTPAQMRKLGLEMPEKKTVASSWESWAKESAVPKIEEAFTKLRSRHLLAEESGDAVPSAILREIKSLDSLRTRFRDLDQNLANGNWVMTDYEKGGVTFKPILVAPYGDKLWKHDSRFLLMSGTIICASVFAEELGLEKRDWGFVQSRQGFPVERRPIRIWPSGDMGKATEEQDRPKMVRRLLEIFRMHPTERGIVHTVSFARAKYFINEICRIDHTMIDRIVTYRTADERDAAIAYHYKTPGSVIFGASLGRGIDAKHDRCRFNVLTKIPYPYLGDKQVSARFHAKGGKLWYVVDTIRTIVQMLGRLIRSSEDWGISYILDTAWLKLWRENHHLIPQYIKDAITNSPVDTLVAIRAEWQSKLTEIERTENQSALL